MGSAESIAMPEGTTCAEDGDLVTFAKPLLESTVEPIVLTDVTNGKIIHCNSSWEALCGYSTAEAVGCTNAFLQGPATDSTEAKRLSDKLRSGAGQAEATLWNYRKDGSGFWNHVTIELVHLPFGRAVHVGFLEQVLDYVLPPAAMGSADELKTNSIMHEVEMQRRADEAWSNCSGRRRTRVAARADEPRLEHEALVSPCA